MIIFMFYLTLPKSLGFSDEFSSRADFFQAYKPIYFIVGKNAKINLSFKSQVIGSTPFYFAYTQAMIWQVFKDVPYFSDINYNPEFFYRYAFQNKALQSIDFVFMNHESNGEGGRNEKSWNRSGLKFQWTTEYHESAKIYWSLNLWFPYSYQKFNPDIVKYRGLGELVVTLTQFIGKNWDQDDLTFRIFWSGQELTLRVKAKNRSVLPLFIAQVYHGFGETLNTYHDQSLGFRLGIGF